MVNKPPIGLAPRHIANIVDLTTESDRFIEVYEAIKRYHDEALPINIEWVEEYNELVKNINEKYMKKEDFKKPLKVWINAPSILQPWHGHHGKRGIAVLVDDVVIFSFLDTEATVNMEINPLYLDRL